MDAANPAQKGHRADGASVDVTNENAQGGIYYWTTQPNPAIVRYDVSKPTCRRRRSSPTATQPATGCVGCHTLSRDGTKIAMTLDGAESQRAAIYDVATQASDRRDRDRCRDLGLRHVQSAATKLFTTFKTADVNLRNLDGTLGRGIAFAPMTSGSRITQPEVSPDGTKLVTVEFASGSRLLRTGRPDRAVGLRRQREHGDEPARARRE